MAKSQNRVALQETYNLPSAGKLYGGNIPESITLRAMTTMDEKMRLSTTGLSSFIALLKSCIIEPEVIDPGELKMFDLQFLLYKLRTVTYGSKYTVNLTCPHCGKNLDIVTDLDDLDVTSIDDDFAEPFEIKLPVSGDTITCGILSVNDLIEIERESKKMLAKFKEYVGNPEFILGYKYMIKKINGETVPDFKVQKYVEEMHARDLMYFDSIYDSKVDNIGLDLSCICECSACGEDIEYSMPINSEFFRPRYSL